MGTEPAPVPEGYSLIAGGFSIEEQDYTPSGRAILEALGRKHRDSFILTRYFIPEYISNAEIDESIEALKTFLEE
jgi:hypothetical protein